MVSSFDRATTNNSSGIVMVQGCCMKMFLRGMMMVQSLSMQLKMKRSIRIMPVMNLYKILTLKVIINCNSKSSN